MSNLHSLRRGLGATWLGAAAAVVPLTLAMAASDTDAVLFGFRGDESAQQLAIERRFDAQLNPADLSAWMKLMSSAANHVGAPHDKENAEFVRDRFREWGWNAQIETFEVLYPTLKAHRLELVGPDKFVAKLSEPRIEGDATSGRTDAMGPYVVYGADGDVTAGLVYVNYGMPEDYQELARRGIDVQGKIVIARYGGGWRGLKPKLAQQHGAVGCIIYSDPRDDGYSQGDVYPLGGWRPSAAVQRGSVIDLPVAPGDPLTPDVGATQNAKRLPLEQANTILKIPVMPISYEDAQPLLSALTSAVAPESWRGSLPITYHIGPGAAQVHLSISSNWSMTTLYDVIAKIPGTQYPDEWLIRGNHRDGWVYGAWDPLSGHVAMLAEAKAIGALLKSGWHPKRTLVFASWDGEEAGLLGSTEWVETHAAELERKSLLYVNSDTNSRGFLEAGGSHSLQKLFNEVAGSVTDPETGIAVSARLRAKRMVDGFGKGASEQQKADAKAAASGGDFTLQALGSGSDYTPFIQHLGITALNVEYNGEEEQLGVYHSKYDSFDHYRRFGDPEFRYGIAEAKTVGHVILRLADAEVAPFQFGAFATAVHGYLQELHHLVDDKRKHSSELGVLLDAKAFSLAADPSKPALPPEREAQVPPVNLEPLDNVVGRLKASAAAYDAAYLRLLRGSATLSPPRKIELNAQLRGMERRLTLARGLPGRDWYKHFIYAPGLLTGYGVKTLPAVREAIDEAHWADADAYAAMTAGVLATYCDALDTATALIDRDLH
jgi:N-acetylated-alpha-linked acidic dipeptidase